MASEREWNPSLLPIAVIALALFYLTWLVIEGCHV